PGKLGQRADAAESGAIGKGPASPRGLGAAAEVENGGLVRARDRHDEVLAHHVLAGDHLLGFAALFVEHDGGKLLQGVARFVQGTAMRVHAGQLFDEADVAGVGLEIHSGKRETTLFHSFLLPEKKQGYAVKLAKVLLAEK